MDQDIEYVYTILIQRFCLLPAGQPFSCGIHGHNAALRVGSNNAFSNTVERGSQPSLALLQLSFGLVLVKTDLDSLVDFITRFVIVIVFRLKQ